MSENLAESMDDASGASDEAIERAEVVRQKFAEIGLADWIDRKECE